MKPKTADWAFAQVIEYIDEVIAGFHHDPADSDYQRGYEAAYKEAKRMLITMRSASKGK